VTATLGAMSRVRAAVASPARLTVLYDDQCALCIRCRHWLEAQPTYVELSFAPTSSPSVHDSYRPHLPWVGYELVVISDRGEAWIGPAAFLVCLWATVRYRDWSYRLASPALAPLARAFIDSISARRQQIGAWLDPQCIDGSCHHHR
jgi:predicted DCC family thiol-disulfide oxidoreductase YuxK